MNTEQLYVLQIDSHGLRGFFESMDQITNKFRVGDLQHARRMSKAFAEQAFDRCKERKVHGRIVTYPNLDPISGWADAPVAKPLTLADNWQTGVYRDRHGARLLEIPWTLNRTLSTYYCRVNPEVSVSAPSLPELFMRLTTTRDWEEFLKAFEVEDLATALQPQAAPAVSPDTPEATAPSTITTTRGAWGTEYVGVRPGSSRPA